MNAARGKRSGGRSHRAINVPLARATTGQLRLPAATRTPRSAPMSRVCGHPSKLVMRVRFPSPAPARKPSSRPLSPGGQRPIRKLCPSFVPVACPIALWQHPSAGSRRTPAPCPRRSPHPALWSRASGSAQRGYWSAPYAPSARAGSRPLQPPSCFPYAAGHASAARAGQPRRAPWHRARVKGDRETPVGGGQGRADA